MSIVKRVILFAVGVVLIIHAVMSWRRNQSPFRLPGGGYPMELIKGDFHWRRRWDTFFFGLFGIFFICGGLFA